nr:calmodulin-binding protein 60 A-like isoform X2 [Ipomoea batatas]GMD24069.1 calmodulin-binding protein 60 A-like isoform X2 [Ipomoea batatas]
MVGVCKLRMIVIAFLQPFVRGDDLVKFYGVLETDLTALRRAASRSLQLKFSQELPAEVFTGEWIVAKGDGSLEVALVDGATGDVVKHGPGASGKIEIVPVEGSFDPSRENGSFDDFNTKIVVGEDGRTSLLGKNPYLEMKEGNAPVCGIKFKHRGKWMKKGKFRLGARFVHQPNAIRIREAVSEPFVVKDQRLKPKKCYPPSPTDEVWRLKNIGKEGVFHNRLVEKEILTVKDFLIEFSKDPKRLRDVLGNMPNAKWKATLDHALTCCPPQIMPSPTNDLAAPSSSAAFGNSELLQHENNNYCGLGSELLLSQTCSADATTLLKALTQSDNTDDFSQLFSDEIFAAGCDHQNAPSNSEDYSEWVNTYNSQLGIDADIYSFSLTDDFSQLLQHNDEASAGVAAAIPKSSWKGWAKLCSLVRLLSLKKEIESKRLQHVAKKQRLW